MDPFNQLRGLMPFILGVAVDLVPCPKSLVEGEAFVTVAAFYISAQALAHI